MRPSKQYFTRANPTRPLVANDSSDSVFINIAHEKVSFSRFSIFHIINAHSCSVNRVSRRALSDNDVVDYATTSYPHQYLINGESINDVTASQRL